jgi:hypothetical protein
METGFPGRRFRRFSQPLEEMPEWQLKLGYNPFLSHPYLFIIYNKASWLKR